MSCIFCSMESKNLDIDGHRKQVNNCPDFSMLDVLPTHAQRAGGHGLTTNAHQISQCYMSESQDLSRVSETGSHMTTSRRPSEAAAFSNTDATTNGTRPASYVALIAKAILGSHDKRLNLGSIYRWIEKHYPSYTHKGRGWKNSVRHNLSLYECFIKDGRCEDGKGNYWTINPSNIEDFLRGDFRQGRRSRRRGRKNDCYINMLQISNGYLHFPRVCLASEIASGAPTVYSACSDFGKRHHVVDDGIVKHGMNNSVAKCYHPGVTSAWNVNDSTYMAVCNTSVCQIGTEPLQTHPESYKQALHPLSAPRF